MNLHTKNVQIPEFVISTHMGLNHTIELKNYFNSNKKMKNKKLLY